MVLIEEVPQENVAAAPPEKDPEPEQKQPSIAEREEGNGADDEEWVEVSHQDAASLGKEGSKDLDHSGEKHNIPEDPEVYKENLNKAESFKAEGNRHFADGDMEEAMSCYSQALEAAPQAAKKERAIYFANRAACSMRLEDYATAAHDCSEAIELDGAYIKAYLRRSAAFECLEDYERALADVKKILELDPKNSAALAIVGPLEKKAEARREEMKEEMVGKLKELGNVVLGKFGLSIDNFKAEKDPETGSYSIKFQQ